MALPDRAQNILQSLVIETSLQTGHIVFVVHSLGGLVIKQVLRLAESRAAHDAPVRSLLSRVRRIAFIGTPHAGSDLASFGNFFRLITRPRETQSGLSRNDPYLRDLNNWFRGYSDVSKLEVIVLHEAQKMTIVGIPLTKMSLVKWLVVKPDSADPGLSPATRVISVDEDHGSIVSPAERTNFVYRTIREFVSRPTTTEHPQVRIEESLSSIARHVGGQSDALIKLQSEQFSSAGAITKSIDLLREQSSEVFSSLQSSIQPLPNEVVSDELGRRLGVLRKSRFLPDFDDAKECDRLFQDTLTGELSSASPQAKRVAFAWCARIIAIRDADYARRMLREADAIGEGPENTISDAILIALEPGRKPEAWAKLAALDLPAARTVSLFVASIGDDTTTALTWFERAGLSISDLDSDGKLIFLSWRVSLGQWDKAFDELNALNDEDVQNSPMILATAALVRLAQAVHPDLRSAVAAHIPFDSRDFPLAADEEALKQRRMAAQLYRAASNAVGILGHTRFSNVTADYALWLELRDAETEASALSELRRSMNDRRSSLRRLTMALDYNLKLDLAAVEQEIERETALTGGTSLDAALARLALSHTKPTAAEAASYIERHRQQLAAHLDGDAVSVLQAEMLVQSGDADAARAKIASLDDPEKRSADIQRLERLIAELGGADVIQLREDRYKSTQKIADLAILVSALKDRKSWSKLSHYSKKLFDETKDLPHAEFYVNALYELGQDADIIFFLEQNAALSKQSDTVLTFSAWAHYRQGSLTIAMEILTGLMQRRDVINDRILFVNLVIASGDWSALGPFVESEWTSRAARTAKELLRAGVLAQRIGLVARSRELIAAAAECAEADAEVLVGCYSAATAAGWESDAATHEWFEKAVASSGTDGPVRSVNLRELLSMQPSWNERRNKTSEDLVEAKIPMFVAGTIMNQSLLQMYLTVALSNLAQQDPRRRFIVPAFSGARTINPVTAESIALDPTTIMTLAFLGILQKVIDRFKCVYIAHTTLGWLFQESQRIQYHQPSRVRDALEIKRLLDNGLLRRFQSALEPPSELEAEVGEELAGLLVAARAAGSAGASSQLVVRPYPIPKVGTFMDVPANVSDFEGHLVGCRDVVSALRSRGQITGAEEAKALRYLGVHERSWPNKPDISGNATLYLDNVSVSYLQHLNLLGKLRPAGFDVFIPQSEINEGDALVRHEAVSEEAKNLIELIRLSLFEGLSCGKVRLAPLNIESDDGNDEEKIESHPSALLFSAAEQVDAFAFDDRFVNKFAQVKTESGVKSVLTTIDLMEGLVSSGLLSQEDHSELRTKLRRAGLLMLPHSEAELRRLVSSAHIDGGIMVETAELRSIRESILRIRMTDVLQLPEEHVWFRGLHETVFAALKSFWTSELSVADASARSDWLLTLTDYRGWVHRLPGSLDDPLALYRSQTLALMTLPEASEEVRDAYWSWLTEKVIEPMRNSDPMLYKYLLNYIEAVITERANAPLSELDGHDE